MNKVGWRSDSEVEGVTNRGTHGTATTESVYYAPRRKTHCVLDLEKKTTTAYPINVMGKHISSPLQYGRQDPPGVPQRLRGRCRFAHDVPLTRSLRAPVRPSASLLFSFALSLIVTASIVIRQAKTILVSGTYSSDKAINRSPICAAEFFERLLCCRRLPSCFKDHTPVSGSKGDGPVRSASAFPGQPSDLIICIGGSRWKVARSLSH